MPAVWCHSYLVPQPHLRKSSHSSLHVAAGTAEQTVHPVCIPRQATAPDANVTDTADKSASDRAQDAFAATRAQHSLANDVIVTPSQLTAASTACRTDAVCTSQQTIRHQTIISESSTEHNFQLAAGIEQSVSKNANSSVSGTAASCGVKSSQLMCDALADTQQQPAVSVESARKPVESTAQRPAETGCCMKQTEDSNSPQTDSGASHVYTDHEITCVQQSFAVPLQHQSPTPGLQHECSNGQIAQLAAVVSCQPSGAPAMQAQLDASVVVTRSWSDAPVKATETQLVPCSKAVLIQSNASIIGTDMSAEQSLQLANGTNMQHRHCPFQA